MKIIKSNPNPSGAYPSIMEDWTCSTPSGWLPIADNVDTGAMQTHAGFVTLSVSDGVVTNVIGDDAAYKAWKDAQPAPKEPEPDPVAILAETVADLMYQRDVEKLNGGNTK